MQAAAVLERAAGMSDVAVVVVPEVAVVLTTPKSCATSLPR
jgi:hypothetical protein